MDQSELASGQNGAVVMGYGDYTLDYFLSQFDLSIVQSPLFAQVQPVEPSDWLRDTLRKGRAIAFFSEKSRSEFIVAPILLSCQEMLKDECCVYSGIRLDVDSERGLKGECDFIVARTSPTPTLQAPLLIVVEAKKNDIEEGLGQCAAQMIAARFFDTPRSPPPGLDGVLYAEGGAQQSPGSLPGAPWVASPTTCIPPAKGHHKRHRGHFRPKTEIPLSSL